jgi:hypothetical protein
MSKKHEKTLINFVQLTPNYTSENGYPIFDLMVNSSQPGYVGASNVVFYSEDDKKVSELIEVMHDKEKARQFLEENITDVSMLQDLHKVGIKEMDYSAQLAFRNLSGKGGVKAALKKVTYGTAHLVRNGEMLIFHQSKSPVASLFGGYGEKKDMSSLESYTNMQTELGRLYDSGKAKPEATIKGKAFEKLFKEMNGMEYHKLNDYQKDNFLMFQEFAQTIEITMKGDMKDTPKIIFGYGNKTLEITLPANKTEDFVVSGFKTPLAIKEAADVLYFVNFEIAQDKVAKFMEKRKVKM